MATPRVVLGAGTNKAVSLMDILVLSEWEEQERTGKLSPPPLSPRVVVRAPPRKSTSRPVFGRWLHF